NRQLVRSLGMADALCCFRRGRRCRGLRPEKAPFDYTGSADCARWSFALRTRNRRRTQEVHPGRLMTYLLCALLGGGVLAAICVPLFRKENTLESSILEETEWDLLLRKKERLLANIQDLDFEFKCGKLSESDYSQVRREMAGEVATVLEHIHNLEASLDLDALIRR